MTDEWKIFSSAIDSAANAQIAAIDAKISGETAALEAQAEKKAAAAAAEWKRSEAEHLRSAAALELSARQGESRRVRLARREQYAAEVFDAVRERIAAYTASSDYPVLLAKRIVSARKALGDGKTVIWLRHEDLALAETLKASCPHAEVREGDFALGGLWLSVDARRADMSFDTALDNMRSRFAEIIGMEIEP